MPSRSFAGRPAGLAAACAIALGAWVAAGTMTLGSPGGSRLGLLPPAWVLLVLLAFTVAWRWRWPGITAAPFLAAALLVLLPWLPVPLPPAMLAWSRPLTTFVAVAALVSLGCYLSGRLPGSVLAPLRDPRRAPIAVVGLSVLLYGGAAWRVSPVIPGGDEPHYLIITQSLVQDFDLRIENNHAQGDYRAYHDGDLQPDYLRRGADGEIYSVHMPGVSALVAPAFVLGGYPAAVAFLVLLASIAGGLLWRLAWLATGDAGAAWIGWAAAALSAPVVFHSFTIYPDGPGVLFVLVGLAGLFEACRSGSRARLAPWVVCGSALAALPWLHSRFSLLAGVLGALTAWCLLRAPGAGLRAVAAFLAVPVVSALAWFGFFYWIYGSPDPRAQYGTFFADNSSAAFITSGIGGLLFDPQFGLLPHAPIFAAALAGVVIMVRLPRGHHGAGAPLRLVALALLLLVVPYLVSTTTVRMWWGGWSAPARFIVPLLPPLGIAVAVAWQHATRRATRAVLLGALGVTIATSGLLVWVDRGRLAYDVRQADALWLEWLGPLAALARGVPTFLRTPEPESWLQTTAWVALLLSAWLVVRALERAGLSSRRGVAAALLVAFATAGMLGLSFVWHRNGLPGLEPTVSQVHLLHAAARDRGVGLVYTPLSRARPLDLPGYMVLEPPGHYASSRRREVAVLPGPLPAGTYALELRSQDAASRVTIGIGREHIPLVAITPSPDMPPVVFSFPVNVRALVVVRGGGDETVSPVPLVVRPRRVLPAREAGAGVARQARRYDGATAYFLDDGSFPEPPGFWVGGSRESTVVLHADEPREGLALRLRNAPVANEVRLDAGQWRDRLQLAPGEARRVLVPLDPRGVARVRLEVSGGFRPAEHEPGSHDHRFLGAWVEFE
jgi:hypothetical protein